MKLSVRDASGAEVRQIDVDDAVFGIDPNLAVVHQAALAQLANARQGTHQTLNRSDVRGSTAKIRRQKGTGRARAGSANSPIQHGGGVAHGPHPRSYRQALPKRMRRLAIRSMLSQRAAEGGLIVLDGAVRFEPRTAAGAALLRGVGVERKGLVVSGDLDQDLTRSLRNLPQVTAISADTLNVLVLLNHDQVVMTESAVRRAEALWGGERASKRRVPAEVEA